ncbi:MAG: hypothetical protein AAB883_01110 [Patescibacteria group bacterium]
MKYGNLTLGQVEAGINKIGGEEAFMRLLRDELVICEAVAKKLLRFIRTISLPAIGEFVASEKFREGKTVDGIKIAWIGNNFKTNFLEKVEKPVSALETREHELVAPARDPAIITELGGEDKVETTLGQFWEFLKTADQTLVYVRHIRDVNDVLWAVRGRWDSGGLNAGTDSLGDPLGWDVGRRFLSR